MTGFSLWRSSLGRSQTNGNEEPSEQNKDDLIKELFTKLQAAESEKIALMGQVDALSSAVMHLQKEVETCGSFGMFSNPSSICSPGRAKQTDSEARSTSPKRTDDDRLPNPVLPIAARRPEGSRSRLRSLQKQRWVQEHSLSDGSTRVRSNELQQSEHGSPWPAERMTVGGPREAYRADGVASNASRTATMESLVSFSFIATMQPGSITLSSSVKEDSYGMATSDVCYNTGDRRRTSPRRHDALLGTVAHKDQLKHARQQASSAFSADVIMLVDLAIMEGILAQEKGRRMSVDATRVEACLALTTSSRWAPRMILTAEDLNSVLLHGDGKQSP